MTPARSLIGLFVAPINRADIEYMVTGGLAAVVYGHPRLTLDIDLVIRFAERQADVFASLWSPDAFYCPPAASIIEEHHRPSHGHFNVIHKESAMRADVYLAGDDALSAWALPRRVARLVEGETVQFAPIEYVILNKLRYFQMGGSDRHLRDIARMMEISGDAADLPALDAWITRLGVDAAWAQARSFEGRE